MRLPLPRWTAPALLLIFVGAARPGEPHRFSMILSHNGNSWHATCETGCTWDEVSATNGSLPNARVRIDNTSISTWATTADSAATFAFTVESDGAHGWQATGLRGTAWDNVGFSCPMATCRARLTEAGVSGLP